MTASTATLASFAQEFPYIVEYVLSLLYNSMRSPKVNNTKTNTKSPLREFFFLYRLCTARCACRYEWEPIRAAGRGDVVFSDGGRRFAVVEVKSITFVNGSTSRAKRTTKRKHVRGQALRYARIYRHQARSKLGSHVDVTPCVFTNDNLSRMTILEEQRNDNNNVSFRSRRRNVCS